VLKGRKKISEMVTADEHPRANSSLEALAGLRPIVPEGIITAGNASGVNDGAGALIIGSREAGEKAGLAPRARLLAGAVAGVPPRRMGLGPVAACEKAFARAGLTSAAMDDIDIHPASAAQLRRRAK